MRIHFWGVRGSIPSPMSSLQIQNRIAAVVQRITPKDIESADTREKFLSSLPEWIFGTVGGNTSCVELENSCGECIIFDAGSGLRELSLSLRQRPGFSAGGRVFHIFFSHFHWDHIQGIPFFSQAFDPRNHLIFYSTNPDLERILCDQMKQPYFPVPMIGPGGFRAKIDFIHLVDPEIPVVIGDSKISWLQVNHPGGCVAYKVTENDTRFVYSTDTELTRDDFLDTPENKSFFSGADVLVLDSQYTMGEAIEKNGWGHSAFSLSVDLALKWEVKNLVLFHHEPTYSDKKIYTLRQSAEWYREYAGTRLVNIYVAREGLELFI